MVIATGAKAGPCFWPVKGDPRTFDTFSAWERRIEDWENRVVIVGGDSAGCFLALYVAGRCGEVHVIDAKTAFADDKMSPGRELLLMSLEALPAVHLRHETTVEEIGEGYVVLQKNGGLERLEGVGSVVMGGRAADNQLYEQILAEDPDLEVYNIGDSVGRQDGRGYNRVHSAREADNRAGK